MLAAVFMVCCGCRDSGPESADLSGPTMGTHYRVVVPLLPQGLSIEELRSLIEADLERVNALMSAYREDSEISGFNRHAGGDWFDVSPETARVVAAAQRVSAASGGAFDVTVGPLVNLWNFGPWRRRGNPLPDAESIEEAMSVVGFGRLEVREFPPALRKLHDGLQVDLSAIAKGYAVDRVSRTLACAGAADYLVDIGGEIRTSGRREDGSRWSIGIEAPADDARRAHEILAAGDCALATSGDYRRFFERDGLRYSHTIDPRTGRPVEHRLASVTVIARSCMLADAWATALMVLGPDDGFRAAEENGLAAFLLVRIDGGFLGKATHLFEKRFPDLSSSGQ